MRRWTLGPQRQGDAEDADGERHPQREEARATGATAGQLRRERENGRGHEDRVAVAGAHERREREAGERKAERGRPRPETVEQPAPYDDPGELHAVGAQLGRLVDEERIGERDRRARHGEDRAPPPRPCQAAHRGQAREEPRQRERPQPRGLLRHGHPLVEEQAEPARVQVRTPVHPDHVEQAAGRIAGLVEGVDAARQEELHRLVVPEPRVGQIPDGEHARHASRIASRTAAAPRATGDGWSRRPVAVTGAGPGRRSRARPRAQRDGTVGRARCRKKGDIQPAQVLADEEVVRDLPLLLEEVSHRVGAGRSARARHAEPPP